MLGAHAKAPPRSPAAALLSRFPGSRQAVKIQPGPSHPPGLYGNEDGFRALNLIDDNATLAPFNPAASGSANVRPYPTAAPVEISPWLIALAVALLAIDALAVLWLNGGLRFRRRQTATASIALVAGLALALAVPHASRAADASSRERSSACLSCQASHCSRPVKGTISFLPFSLTPNARI